MAYRSSTVTTYASRTNTTVTAPAGLTDGDFILVGIVTTALGEFNAPAVTPPAGWTLVSGTPCNSGNGVSDNGTFNLKLRLYWKIANSEGASWTFTHSTCTSLGAADCWSGIDSTTPFDVAITANFGTRIQGGQSSTSTGLSITPVTNGATIVFYEHDWLDTSTGNTPPSGTTPTFTERRDSSATSLMYMADGVLATAGATGNKTMTNNNSGTNPWCVYMLALRPASSGTAYTDDVVTTVTTTTSETDSLAMLEDPVQLATTVVGVTSVTDAATFNDNVTTTGALSTESTDVAAFSDNVQSTGTVITTGGDSLGGLEGTTTTVLGVTDVIQQLSMTENTINQVSGTTSVSDQATYNDTTNTVIVGVTSETDVLNDEGPSTPVMAYQASPWKVIGYR